MRMVFACSREPSIGGAVVEDSAAPRILAVDDLESIRSLIHRVLTTSGYRVDTVASLAEARRMDPAGYDGILVDNSLGDECGADLIAELVAEDPAAAGRCLLITGSGPYVLPPGVAWLAKPFGPSDLIRAVEALHQAAPVSRPGPRTAHRSSPPATGATARGPGIPATAPPPAGSQRTRPPGATSGPAAPDGGRPADGSARAATRSDAWPLLSLVHRIRAGQRAAIADFVHDGPIQELTSAMLSLRMLGRQAPGELAQDLDEVQHRLEMAARAMRRLVDDDVPALESGADLPETIRRHSGWLPFSSVSAIIGHGPAEAPGTSTPAQAALIADIVELALFSVADCVPAAHATVVVETGPDTVQIELTVRPADGSPGETADPVGFQAELAELAGALGGTAVASPGGVVGRARIELPAVSGW